MVKELNWDSIFFNKKIGELLITAESFSGIRNDIEKAKADGFKYIICKPEPQKTSLIHILESFNFYLVDIGITLAIETDSFLFKKHTRPPIRQSIKIAVEKDIPELKKVARSLFMDGRFYHDPFFSRKEADSLYQTWIENSVKGKTADIVLCIPHTGFVICKKCEGKKGEIVLFGIRKGLRNKGIGTILMEEAIKWCKTEGLATVSVRTQLRNINAMNFYLKAGFYVKEHDIVFGKIL